MVQTAMDRTAVRIKPVYGALVHTDIWEGPCRAGPLETLGQDAELQTERHTFEAWITELRAELAADPRTTEDAVEIVDPVFARFTESLIPSDGVYQEIGDGIESIDLIVGHGRRFYGIERYQRPVTVLNRGVSAVDVIAGCRRNGVEAWVSLDYRDLCRIIHLLRVRKAVAATRALVLTAGRFPSWGVLSNITDHEGLRRRYGFTVETAPFPSFAPAMDDADRRRATTIAEELQSAAGESRIATEDLANDAQYYLGVEEMLDRSGADAFSTSCFELCASRAPQNRRFVPCLTHSLLKDRGIPSACEEDINALLAMTVLQYLTGQTAFMGNPLFENEEMISIHHAVPGRKMEGRNAADLPFDIWTFTHQGFGAKMQVDLAESEVTIARFDPQGTRMLLKTGRVVKTEYREDYCSPWYYIAMEQARAYIHAQGDFGHHQVLVLGDHRADVRALSKIMGFSVYEPDGSEI